MYTRQVIGSLVVSLGVGAVVFTSGYAALAVLAAVSLTYLVLRWGWATYQRTRYWLSRGTDGVYTEYCPNCNRSRYRISGDWILECRQCGWKPGRPGVRWLTRSVPAIQLRRSMSRMGAFAAGVSITILLAARPTGGGSPTLNFPVVSVDVPSLPSGEQLAIFGVLVVALIIAILWALRPRQYYCRGCGQDLGRGDPPERCPKCGSNRFTHEDPGVGKKLRIERVE